MASAEAIELYEALKAEDFEKCRQMLQNSPQVAVLKNDACAYAATQEGPGAFDTTFTRLTMLEPVPDFPHSGFRPSISSNAVAPIDHDIVPMPPPPARDPEERSVAALRCFLVLAIMWQIFGAILIVALLAGSLAMAITFVITRMLAGLRGVDRDDDCCGTIISNIGWVMLLATIITYNLVAVFMLLAHYVCVSAFESNAIRGIWQFFDGYDAREANEQRAIAVYFVEVVVVVQN